MTNSNTSKKKVDTFVSSFKAFKKKVTHQQFQEKYPNLVQDYLFMLNYIGLLKVRGSLKGLKSKRNPLILKDLPISSDFIDVITAA